MKNAKKSDSLTLLIVTSLLVAAIAISGTRLVGIASAGEADVVKVRATQESSGTWRFDVTVAHEDTGWDHYADRWDIVSPDGSIVEERVLLHPHVNEQPFTRSLRGVVIPDNVDQVTVRAHDNVHKLGGKDMLVDLPR